jgi:hypothetical protein
VQPLCFGDRDLEKIIEIESLLSDRSSGNGCDGRGGGSACE